MDTKKTTEEKLWSEPELIVLTRSNPEEFVLSSCKGTFSVQQLPVGVFFSCGNIAGSYCLACTSLTAS